MGQAALWNAVKTDTDTWPANVAVNDVLHQDRDTRTQSSLDELRVKVLTVEVLSVEAEGWIWNK